MISIRNDQLIVCRSPILVSSTIINHHECYKQEKPLINKYRQRWRAVIGHPLFFSGASYSGQHWQGSLAFPTVRLDKHAYGESYKDFLQELRDAIPGKGSSHGIPVLPAAVGQSDQFVLVEIEGHKGTKITFALNVIDLYLVAFEVGGNSYFFVDKSGKTYVSMDKVFKNSKLRKNVGRGDYDHLESKAKEMRGARSVGVSALIQAVTDLANEIQGSKENLQTRARALLVIIQMISEAARFKVIEDEVTSAESVKLRPESVELENNWLAISREAQTSDELPQRAEGLALMKYYRN